LACSVHHFLGKPLQTSISQASVRLICMLHNSKNRPILG